jgi:ketosteroid isomerase-like protein
MRSAAPPHSSADDLEQVFYEALQSGDLERLMACWADEDDIVCVHPGGPRLVGHAAIRASFEQLLQNGHIHTLPERVHRIGVGPSAVHSVVERVEVPTHDGPRHAHVIATNIYTKTAQGWRLVLHHASPGTVAAKADVAARPKTLH